MGKSKIVILTFIVLTIKIYADDGAVRANLDSGNVFLVEDDNIIMVRELVEYKDDSFYTRFLFKNDSNEERTVLIGFPVYGNVNAIGGVMMPHTKPNELPLNEKLDRIERYYNFKSMINGVEIPRKLISANEDDEYGF